MERTACQSHGGATCQVPVSTQKLLDRTFLIDVLKTTIREVEKHGVIEHRAVGHGHALESGDNAFDQRHAMMTATCPDLFASEPPFLLTSQQFNRVISR
jgi:hypothetical protein